MSVGQGVSLGSDIAAMPTASPSDPSINDLIGSATQRVELVLNLVSEYEARIHGSQPKDDADVVGSCPNGLLEAARHLGHLVDNVHERLQALLPIL